MVLDKSSIQKTKIVPKLLIPAHIANLEEIIFNPKMIIYWTPYFMKVDELERQKIQITHVGPIFCIEFLQYYYEVKLLDSRITR